MTNERYEDKGNAARDGGTDRTLAALMSLAGPRAEISPDIEARVRANVEREWSRATAKRRFSRRAVPLALAASVLLAWMFGLRGTDVGPPPVIGTIARVADAAAGHAVGDDVRQGDTLSTAASGLSFSLPNATSVRLAAASSMRVDAGDAFTLLTGRVYVDTGESIYRDRRITINTEFGSVTDIGTQFAVSLQGAELRVAVREGRVDIATARETIPTEAGRRVIVTADAASTLEPVAPTDDEWDWAEALAPEFDLEGKSLLDFLKWVARETGMELEFQQDSDRLAAMTEIMSGSIEDLTPMEALASVMPTTSFEYVIDGDAISVAR